MSLVLRAELAIDPRESRLKDRQCGFVPLDEALNILDDDHLRLETLDEIQERVYAGAAAV